MEKHMQQKRFEAIQKGEKRYRGKECVKCGADIRYTLNDNCVSCSAAHVKKHRNKMRELIAKAKEQAVQQ
jgi:rRNA maturation protein Nop10